MRPPPLCFCLRHHAPVHYEFREMPNSGALMISKLRVNDMVMRQRNRTIATNMAHKGNKKLHACTNQQFKSRKTGSNNICTVSIATRIKSPYAGLPELLPVTARNVGPWRSKADILTRWCDSLGLVLLLPVTSEKILDNRTRCHKPA